MASALALLLSGCGGSAGTGSPSSSGPASPPGRPDASAGSAPLAELARAPVGRVVSARFGIAMPLPDPDGWRLVHGKSSFLVMQHPASASELVVRVWRETENMNRDKCEQRVRELRALPAADRAGSFSREPLDVPPEFDTMVDVGFTAGSPAEPLSGYLVAFGGFAHRCFAFAFTTRASGPGAEQIVGDRLAVMDARTLGGLELQSDTTPVTREPHGGGSAR